MTESSTIGVKLGSEKVEIISKCRHKINNVYGTSAEQENNDVYIDWNLNFSQY